MRRGPGAIMRYRCGFSIYRSIHCWGVRVTGCTMWPRYKTIFFSPQNSINTPLLARLLGWNVWCPLWVESLKYNHGTCTMSSYIGLGGVRMGGEEEGRGVAGALALPFVQVTTKKHQSPPQPTLCEGRQPGMVTSWHGNINIKEKHQRSLLALEST